MEFYHFTRIEPTLEPKLRELYERHLLASAKVDWTYATLLPWERGRNFQTEPWAPGQRHLSQPIYVAVETALLTEVNLPWFTSGLEDVFRGSLTVLHDFIRTWTAEEDQHSDILQTYLLLTRDGDPAALHRLRHDVIQQGFTLDYATPIEMMVYTTIQELATRAFYGSIARVAEPEDPVLARILRRLAQDESLHFGFYRDVVMAHLAADPNFVWPVAKVLRAFAMPGRTMPDFPHRMRTIAGCGAYGMESYYQEVIQVLVRQWGIDALAPSLAEAVTARSAILTHCERLHRLAGLADHRAGQAMGANLHANPGPGVSIPVR